MSERRPTEEEIIARDTRNAEEEHAEAHMGRYPGDPDFHRVPRIPEAFDIATAVEDFAGPGREIREEPDCEFDNLSWPRRHIWVHTAGWVLSATWSWGTYCTGARQNHPLDFLDHDSPSISPNAEVAVWRESEEEMIELDGDSVQGYVSPAAFLAAIEAAERDDEEGIRRALIRGE